MSSPMFLILVLCSIFGGLVSSIYSKKVGSGVCPFYTNTKDCSSYYLRKKNHQCNDDSFCNKIVPGWKCCMSYYCERRCFAPMLTRTLTEKVCRRRPVGIQHKTVYSKNPNYYLQIDLGDVHVVCAVATQVGHNVHTTKYKISTSLDQKVWTTYPNNSSPKVFNGSKYGAWSYRKVKNDLEKFVNAKYIRFIPTKFIKRKALKVEVYGIPVKAINPPDPPKKTVVAGVCPRFLIVDNCPKKQSHRCSDDGDCTRTQPGTKCCLKGCNRMCVAPMPSSDLTARVCRHTSIGVEDRSIFSDNKFTASSELNIFRKASQARLNTGRGWIPKDSNNTKEYLQIDLGKVFAICALAIRGNTQYFQYRGAAWTTEFKISTSLDNKLWTYYSNNSSPKIFKGNKYNGFDASYMFLDSLPARARFIRFIPTKFVQQKALRVKLFGLPVEALPSTCPVFPTAAKCPRKMQHQCGKDTDCNAIKAGTKCCLKSCQRLCLDPARNLAPIKHVVVPGKCPVFPTAAECPVYGPEDIDVHDCLDDFDCSKIKPGTKCCMKTCERRCVVPVST